MQFSIMTSDVEVKVLKVTFSVDSSSLFVMPCSSDKDKATVAESWLSKVQVSVIINPSAQILVFSEAVYKSYDTGIVYLLGLYVSKRAANHGLFKCMHSDISMAHQCT